MARIEEFRLWIVMGLTLLYTFLVLTPAAYLWPSCYTLIGALLGASSLFGARRGSVRWKWLDYRSSTGCLCFVGGAAGWLMRRTGAKGIQAMTLGHAVLFRDTAAMIRCFSHEAVHVRQYQWLGPFYLPAYLVAAAWTAATGPPGRRHPFRDNWFERQAYRKGGGL